MTTAAIIIALVLFALLVHAVRHGVTSFVYWANADANYKNQHLAELRRQR